MHLIGFEVRTVDGRAEIGELIFENALSEQHAETRSQGYSVGIPLNPMAYTTPNAALTVATAISLQGEKKTQDRRLQAVGAGLYSIHPLTGRIRKLRQIGRDTGVGTLDPTTGQTSLTPEAQVQARAQLQVDEETRESLPEVNTSSHTAWAVPLSTVAGVVSDVSWLSRQLTPMEEPVVQTEVQDTQEKLLDKALEEAPNTVATKKAASGARAFLADPEVKKATRALILANKTLLQAHQERSVGAQPTKKTPPPLPQPKVKAGVSSSLSSSAPTTSQTSTTTDLLMQNLRASASVETEAERLIRGAVSSGFSVGAQRQVEIAEAKAREAQGAISRAYARFAAAYPDSVPLLRQVAEGALGLVSQGLRLWGYTEAGLAGMAAGAAGGAILGAAGGPVGILVGGPAGSLVGGAAGLLAYNAVEQTVSAGTEKLLQAAYEASPTAGELLEVGAAALALRTGRKTLTKAKQPPTLPPLKQKPAAAAGAVSTSRTRISASTSTAPPQPQLKPAPSRATQPAAGPSSARPEAPPEGFAGARNFFEKRTAGQENLGTSLNAQNRLQKPVEAYEVGKCKDLYERSIKGDGMEVHHAPQKHPAVQTISEYDPQTAPGIVLPKPEHQRIPNIRGSYTGTARDLLAQDVRNLRAHTQASNAQIQDLIALTKETCPKAMEKGPRK